MTSKTSAAYPKVKFKKRGGWTRRKTFFAFISFILILYCITMLAPCYFLLINSLKDSADYATNVWSLPQNWLFSNYARVSEQCVEIVGISIWGMYFNSILIMAISVLLATAATTVTAYTLARFDFFGKKLLVAIGIGVMLIPDLGSAATVYKLFVDLNMIDTGFVLFMNASPFGMMFLIMYSLFTTVSGTYAEAAKIDGASEMRVFVQIMIPMAKGTIGMMMVMSAIGAWNNFYVSYMYLPTVKTLALGLQEFVWATQNGGEMPILYAALTLGTIPLIILFISMRDVIINNAVAGGIKG